MLHRNIVLPAGRHTASLIFLHGSGDTGVGVQSWVKEVLERAGDRQGFNFNHIKVIYPTAPLQPYTPMLGSVSNVWFDRQKISFKAPENSKSIESMSKQLSDIIQEEKNAGISPNRIIVGGFSMGGSMALHLGYKKHTNLKAVFALSSFLSEKSSVYEAIKAQRDNNDVIMPELLMCHGRRDSLVLYEWGKTTFDELESLGVGGKFKSFDFYHEIGSDEMILVKKWILELLPGKIANNKL